MSSSISRLGWQDDRHLTAVGNATTTRFAKEQRTFFILFSANLHWLITLAIVAVLGGGCSPQSKESRLMRRATEQFEAGDYERAEIEYMNALEANRTNLVAVRQLALIALEQGRLPRAYGLYSEASKIWPDDFEIRLKLVLLRLPGGRTQELHDEATRLVALQPTNPEALAMWVDSLPATNDIQQSEGRLQAYEGTSGQTAGYHLALGYLQLRRQDTAAAEKSFRRALELDPKSSKGHIALGNLFLLKQDQVRAGEEFQAAARLAAPRSSDGLRYADHLVSQGDLKGARENLEGITGRARDFIPAQLRLAQLALRERRLTDCEALLRQVLAREPLHLDARLLLAQTYQAQGEAEKAVTELDDALTRFPRQPAVLYQLAVAHLGLGNRSEAIKHLTQALLHRPDYAEASLLLAEVHLRRGDAEAAVQVISPVIQRRPSLSAAQLILAAAYQAQGKVTEAVRIYEDLIRANPTNAQFPAYKGMALNRLGRTQEAQASLEDAWRLNPDYLPAVEYLIGMDIAGKRLAIAAERAQRQLDRSPTNGLTHLLAARVQIAQTNFAGAEATLNKALELDPGLQAARVTLARVLVAANKHAAALKQYEEAVARNTNDLSSWMQLAELQSAATNHAAAAKAYEKLLAAEPKSGPALNNLAWLYAEHLGDPKRAVNLANKARELMPDDASIADTAGWAAYKAGDYYRSLALLSECAQRLPDHPEVAYHLGMALYMMGEASAAQVNLEKALQSDQEGSWRGQARQRLGILQMNSDGSGSPGIAEWERLRNTAPDDPILSFRLGDAYHQQGREKDAIAAYEKVLTINSNSPKALVALARLYQAGNPGRALELAVRARTLSPDDPVITHRLGKLTYDTAKTATEFQQAHSLLQTSAAALPENPEVLFDLAVAGHAIGQIGNAQEQLQRLLRTQHAPQAEQAKVFMDFVTLAERTSEVTAASSRVAEVLKNQPRHLPALFLVGLAHEAGGRKIASRDSYEGVLKQFPLFAPAHVQLAILYNSAELKDLAKAYDHGSRAREAFPKDPNVARLLGNLAFQRKDYSRSVQLLNEAAPHFQADANLFYDLGMACNEIKESGASKVALTTAIRLAPDSPRAAKAKELLSKSK